MFDRMETPDRDYNVASLRKAYKRISPFYNLWSKLTESKALKEAINFMEITEGLNILEAACGTGGASAEMLKSNESVIIYAVDISPAMLKRARKKLGAFNKSSYVLIIGDALNLSFASNKFDRLLNNFMVDLLPLSKFDLLAKEFYRVLKPNGIAVVTTFGKSNSAAGRFWFRLAKNFPSLLTGCRPVCFKSHLKSAGFVIEEDKFVFQNTFPSQIIKARKPKVNLA